MCSFIALPIIDIHRQTKGNAIDSDESSFVIVLWISHRIIDVAFEEEYCLNRLSR